MFLGAIAAAIGTVSVTEILKHVIDDILVQKDKQALYYVPLFFVVLYLVKGIGRYIQAYFTSYIGQDIVRRLREELLDHMLKLDMYYLNKSRSGELISRITNDIQRIQNSVANVLPEILRDSLIIVSLIVYSIYLNYELAFYALIVLPATFIPLNILSKKMKKISHISQEKNADSTTRLTEIFNSFEVIKANSTEAIERERFSKYNKEFFLINMKGAKIAEFVSPMMEVFGAIGVAAILMAGGVAVINGTMTQGELIAFVTAVGLLYDPIKKIAGLLTRLQDAVAATERVFDIMHEKPTINEGKQTIMEEISSIHFNNVSLRYGETIALKSITLNIQKGNVIALVGDSGGGKSSFVNLLLRFYDPSQGTILFNTTNIKALTFKTLRHHIAMVSQRVYIFQDTLAQNIAYGQAFDRERVLKALNLADAQSFVTELPNGIDTQMEEFGANLSGGQRQRIAIARAIYKDSDILLLDEATSALDNQSEKRIQDALKTIEKTKTTFIIAHRLSTIEHANTILVFKSGQIVDRGTHSELLKNSSEYQRLTGSFVN